MEGNIKTLDFFISLITSLYSRLLLMSILFFKPLSLAIFNIFLFSGPSPMIFNSALGSSLFIILKLILEQVPGRQR